MSDAREELRVALVLNGGVSLAIWMGGAVHEVDRLTRGDDAYAELLTWAMSTARVDVIAGTSAGGINGAAIALSQCNSNSLGMGVLRDTWVDSGSFRRLLRQPFRGSPPALLRGDEFFLPRLNAAMSQLATNYSAPTVDAVPIDLTITGTLLNGVPGVVLDSAGQPISQVRHDGLFRFQRGPTHRVSPGMDDFAEGESISTTIDALALAARTTASFPVAFEPSFVPTSEDAAGRLRPDMSAYLSGAWEESQAGPLSRYVVDGGVLANTPTRTALEAVERMPASGLVRRVMLLVHPHAPAAGVDEPDAADSPPTVVETATGLLGLLTSQGSRNYVDQVHAHNKLAAQRRLMRADVVGSYDDLTAFATQVYPWYRRMRAQRLARDLADLYSATEAATADPQRYDTVHREIAAWVHVGAPGWLPAPGGQGLPSAAELGFDGALGVADAATDFLKRLNWAVSDASTPSLEQVRTARGLVSAARNTILDKRATFVANARRRGRATVPLSSWVERVMAWHALMGSELTGPLATVARAVAAMGEGYDVPVEPGQEADVLAAFTTRLFGGGTDPQGVLARLNDLQVVTYVLSDEVTTGGSLPLDLVQLTFQVQHPFAPGLSGADKVAGDVASRFSAFLKASWRVNDWIWGRLDASRTLCQAVLDPPRVRRYLQRQTGSVDDLVDGLYATLFPALVPGAAAPDLASSLGIPPSEDVVDELERLLADEEASLRLLPQLFAMSLALQVAAEEMPALLEAVRRDKHEGANQRAIGTVAIEANASVCERAKQGDPQDCRQALDVLATCGLGAEPLAQEASSDQMITTATSAAAMAVTLADSDASGLGFVKPVTRGLRGAALLPYWTLTGLSAGGALARSLALVALAAGGVLLVLGVFGLGPPWGVAVGAGVVLAAFAYGSLRSGTLLHSVVLLVPALALLAWAGLDGQGSGTRPGGEDGLAVLAAVLLLVGGLILLGSLTPPIVSPLAWVGSWRRLVSLGAVVGLLAIIGWLLSSARRDSTTEWLWGIGALAGSVGEGVSGVGWQALLDLTAYLAVGYVAASAVFAVWVGRQWRLVTRGAEGWTSQDVEHPAGVTAGWSWVYGAVLLGSAALVLGFGDGFATQPSWLQAAVVAGGVVGVLLLLPVPWALHRRAGTEATQRARAVVRSLPVGAPSALVVTRLCARGLSYAHFVRLTGSPPRPRLTSAGESLAVGRR